MLTLYLSAAKSRSERPRAVRVRISERKEQRNAHPFCGEGTVGEGVDCVDAVYPERWGGGRGLTRVHPSATERRRPRAVSQLTGDLPVCSCIRMWSGISCPASVNALRNAFIAGPKMPPRFSLHHSREAVVVSMLPWKRGMTQRANSS